MSEKNAYAKSGVDVEAGYEVVERIKKHVARTERAGVMGALGGFGGMFDLSKTGVREPVLVSGTDGVGTKLMLAIKYDKHDTIGQDCVAMCVNDIIAAGAEPLYFLDYVATGKNNPVKFEEVVSGVAEGCVQAGAALIGGETAEMPGMYGEDDYDLAGFAVGVAENPSDWQVVTDRQPTEQEAIALEFAWKAIKYVKSNGIIITNDHMTLGLGAGQTNRVGSVKIAIEQAKDHLDGAVLASDAFFPFADNIEEIAAAGIKAIIQPGGSVRDQDSIDAANKHGLTMIFTGVRHFRH